MSIGHLMLVFAFLVLPVAGIGMVVAGVIFLLWKFITRFTRGEAKNAHFGFIWLLSSLGVFAILFGGRI